jgi:hypothetical protein
VCSNRNRASEHAHYFRAEEKARTGWRMPQSDTNCSHDSPRDVDDAIIDRREDQNAQKTRSSSEKSPKLKRAAEISAKSTAEIKAMIAGLRQRRAEIGLRLQQADQYQASAKNRSLSLASSALNPLPSVPTT